MLARAGREAVTERGPHQCLHGGVFIHTWLRLLSDAVGLSVTHIPLSNSPTYAPTSKPASMRLCAIRSISYCFVTVIKYNDPKQVRQRS